jgi:hypothetical protein
MGNSDNIDKMSLSSGIIADKGQVNSSKHRKVFVSITTDSTNTQ